MTRHDYRERHIDKKIVESFSLLSSFRMVSQTKIKFTHVFFIVIFVAGFVSAITWTLSADYFQGLLAAGYYNNDTCQLDK